MLYLYTGVPGAGKTLHMVSQLHKDPQFKERPLYVDGIPDLDPEAIPHIALPEGCNGSNWHEWLPEKSILVIDECQRYWRPRPNGSQVPQAIQALETHRHKGIDIYFLTQDPKKIDSQIRNLIEVHKHFSMSVLGVRRSFEWRNKVGDPNAKGDVKSALVTPYFLDESVYGYYTSSVQHNQVKAKKSKWVYGLPLMMLLGISLIGFGIYKALNIGKDQAQAVQEAAQQQQTAQPAPMPTSSEQVGQSFNLSNQAASQEEQQQSEIPTPEDYRPTIPGQPWTAEVYRNHNGIGQIKTMPYPVACVKSSNKCTCYTEQATPIRNMDTNLCIDFAENGIYNPYRAAPAAEKAQTAAPAETAVNGTGGAQVMEMGGEPLPSLSPANSPDLKVIQ